MSSNLPISIFNLQFSINLPRPPVVFHKLLSIKELWNRNAWKTSCKTSRKTSHRPHLTPPVFSICFSFDSLSACSFQVYQSIASSNIILWTKSSTDGRSYGRSMGGLTGGLTWGLENINILLIRKLANKTGGLGWNDKNHLSLR